jgi:hypothetical protein
MRVLTSKDKETLINSIPRKMVINQFVSIYNTTVILFYILAIQLFFMLGIVLIYLYKNI